MPSLEMLKKLLDEFTEKEAHTREEINVINEQIVELEKRIAASHAKLATCSVDREKVRAMQARYSGASTLTSGPLMNGNAASEADKKEETPRQRPGRAAPSTPEVGIPPAPLNVRSSQTRIPAMKPSEALTETPAASSSASPLFSLEEAPPPVSPATPFLPSEEPALASSAESNKFSPLDIFGTPTDEIPTSSPAAQAAASNSFPFGESTPAQADVPYNTGSATIDIGLPAAAAQPDAGIATSDSPFYSSQSAQSNSASQHAQEPPATDEDEDSSQISDLEDEPDDTVKSINDALRGLFR